MKCQFCKEEVQDGAVKCKHCGEYLDNKAYLEIKEGLESNRTEQQSVAVESEIITAINDTHRTPINPPAAVENGKSLSGKSDFYNTFFLCLFLGVYGAAVVYVIVIASRSRYSGTGTSVDASSEATSRMVFSHDPTGDSYKSKDALLREYAKALHGNDAQVEILSGFSGGLYQVNVRVEIITGKYIGGYHTYSYTAAVDSSSQRVTLWELAFHN